MNAAARGRAACRPVVAATHNKGKLGKCASCSAPYGIEVGRRRRTRPARARGDRRHLRCQRAAQGARRRAGCAACRRSPTIPAFASRRSTARPASIPRAGRARPRISPPRWRASRLNCARPQAPQPWRAYFVSALAIAWPDGHVETFEGRVDGELVFPPRGTAGFGYDPDLPARRPRAHLRRDDRRGEARPSGRRLACAVASGARLPDVCARACLLRAVFKKPKPSWALGPGDGATKDNFHVPSYTGR